MVGILIALVVLVGVIVTLVSGWYWLLIPITYGFWARVLTGPKLSPLGWLAMNVIAPRLNVAFATLMPKVRHESRSYAAGDCAGHA